MATTEELQQRLAAAEAAYHALLIGDATTTVEYDGRRVTKTAASVQVLANYIASLKQQLGQSTGVRAPMRPVFG